VTVSSVPAAFLSYAHVDDEYDRGVITEFRKALEGAVRLQTGRRDVQIFQDRDNIGWGQEWKARIDSSLDAVTFLVPILTPSFFTSDQCRRELQRFLGREQRLSRRDLILPVYWISAAQLDNPARHSQDNLAQELADRQYTDWRELRFLQLTDPVARRALSGLATHFRDALDQAGLPNHSAIAIRANVTEVLHRALDEVRTANPDAVGIVNILVDAIRDSGRLPEPKARTLRWVCQSRLVQPPGALRESTAKSLGPDPDIDLAHADTFRTATMAVIDATAETMVSAASDSSVVAALFSALHEISALTGRGAADGPELALATVRQEVDARLNLLYATAKQHEARLSTTLYMAKQEAKQIVEQAQAQAEETQARAKEQAQAILDEAQREADEQKTAIAERDRAETQPDDSVEPSVVDQQISVMTKIYEILIAEPNKLFTPRDVAKKIGISKTDAISLLTRLEDDGKIACNHDRAHLYYVRSDTSADPGQ
jgi:cell division septum initiation protein DivIVA